MNTNKIDLIRAEVERIQLYTQSEVLKQVLDYIDSLQEEPVSKEIGDYDHKAVMEALHPELKKESVSERFAFKAIPRLLEMIEPTDRVKAYVAKLADALESEGYSTDAKIVMESLKIMNGEKVAMATMDEEPVSEDLEKTIDTFLATYFGSEKEKQDWPFLKKMAIHFADWQKEQFEKNRLKHCNSITNEQAELEQGFIDQHLDKHQRMPTFLDAIEYGMRLQKEKIEEALLSEVLPCFMHGGEADEVVAKLDEVLNQDK